MNEIMKLVLVRLEAMPDNIRVHLGSYGNLGKADLIKHVKSQDDLGKRFVKMQLAYLKSFKEGF